LLVSCQNVIAANFAISQCYFYHSSCGDTKSCSDSALYCCIWDYNTVSVWFLPARC